MKGCKLFRRDSAIPRICIRTTSIAKFHNKNGICEMKLLQGNKHGITVIQSDSLWLYLSNFPALVTA